MILLLLNEIFLTVISSNMRYKTAFDSTFVITHCTSKWFFSSMSSNVSLHVAFHFHNFRTIWTSKFTWTKSNWLILQKNISFLLFSKKLIHRNKIQWYWCVLLMCVVRMVFWFVLKLHRLQLNGFSPVWIRIWRITSALLLIILEQTGQAYCCGPSLIGSVCKKIYRVL